jgi:hypothetical protein
MVLPEGRALERVLKRALQDVERDMSGSRLAGLARAIREGSTQSEFARAEGMREESVSRTLKPRLVGLIRLHVEQLQTLYLSESHDAQPAIAANHETQTGTRG